MNDDYSKLLKQLEQMKQEQGGFEGQIPMRPEEQMVDTSAKEELIQQPTMEQVQQLATPSRGVASEQELPELDIKNTNQDIKSPHLKTSEDKTNDLVESYKNESPKLNADQEYLDLISKYKEELNAPKKDRDWKDSLPDALAGVHNILNYGSGSKQKMMGMDYLKNLEAREAAGAKSRTDKLGGLAGLLKGYKSLDGNKNKIYQTRSGLVQLDKDGNPQELYRDPYMQSGAEDRRASLDLRKDKFGFDQEIKGRLSDKEVSEITELDEGTRMLGEIENLLNTTDVEQDLGPYASTLEQAKNYNPMSDGPNENFTKIQQLVGTQLAEYIKSISGAAVSEQEAQRLLKNIPNVSDKPKAFKAKLKQFREQLQEAKEEKLGNIGKQKSGAKNFEDKSTSERKEVRRKTKDGRTAIFDAETKEFIKYE